MTSFTQKLRAFTLIELLVVISIIGILAALLLANFAGIRDRAEDAKNKNNLKQVQTSLRMRYNDIQAYPNTSNALCSGLTDITANLDADEIPSTCYYSVGTTTDAYIACITLHNTADKEAAESVAKCTGLTPPAAVAAAGRYCICAK